MDYDKETFQHMLQLITAAKHAVKKRGKRQLEAMQIHKNILVNNTEIPGSGILVLADWSPTYKTINDRLQVHEDVLPSLKDQLEEIGINTGWIGYYKICDICKNLIKSPDDLLLQYVEIPGVVSCICSHCVETKYANEYFQLMENNSKNFILFNDINLGNYGYSKILSNCITGLIAGQNDSPDKIAETLHHLGITKFVIKVLSATSFDMHFDVYIHETQLTLFNQKKYEEQYEK